MQVHCVCFEFQVLLSVPQSEEMCEIKHSYISIILFQTFLVIWILFKEMFCKSWNLILCMIYILLFAMINF
jgi:hypothetical protein